MKGLALARAISALILCGLIAPVYAQQGILGFYPGDNPGVEAPPSAGQRANFKRGSKFTMTENGLLDQLCAEIDGAGGSTARSQLFSVVLYSDKNGLPGTKLAETPGYQQLNPSFGGVRGSACEVMSHVPLTPGDYWIMLHTGGTAGVIRYFQGPDANWYGNPDTFSDGASQEFGSGGVAGSGTVSVYARYRTTSEYATAGRTTIGANPSAGLRSDFKRGSPIDVTVAGRIERITAYVDGLGGNTGRQDISAALYTDADGVPGYLVVDSGPYHVPAGWQPRWGSFRVPVTDITPGRYWIVLHTGQNTGIIRYYADGAGNWYGNADAFTDGPTNPFGNGTTGNGRISAFASIMLN